MGFSIAIYYKQFIFPIAISQTCEITNVFLSIEKKRSFTRKILKKFFAFGEIRGGQLALYPLIYFCLTKKILRLIALIEKKIYYKR
jgi:hypothetical protein